MFCAEQCRQCTNLIEKTRPQAHLCPDCECQLRSLLIIGHIGETFGLDAGFAHLHVHAKTHGLRESVYMWRQAFCICPAPAYFFCKQVSDCLHYDAKSRARKWYLWCVLMAQDSPFGKFTFSHNFKVGNISISEDILDRMLSFL